MSDSTDIRGATPDNPSVNIQGNVEGSLNVAGRDINIYSGSPTPAVADLLQNAWILIHQHDYAGAAQYCSSLLTIKPDHAEANFLAVVALMQGHGADRLSEVNIKRVEFHLNEAAKDMYFERTSLTILGAIKFDHYVSQGLFEGQPSVSAIQARLHELTTAPLLKDMLDLVKISSAAIRTFNSV